MIKTHCVVENSDEKKQQGKWFLCVLFCCLLPIPIDGNKPLKHWNKILKREEKSLYSLSVSSWKVLILSYEAISTFSISLFRAFIVVKFRVARSEGSEEKWGIYVWEHRLWVIIMLAWPIFIQAQGRSPRAWMKICHKSMINNYARVVDFHSSPRAKPEGWSEKSTTRA